MKCLPSLLPGLSFTHTLSLLPFGVVQFGVFFHIFKYPRAAAGWVIPESLLGWQGMDVPVLLLGVTTGWHRCHLARGGDTAGSEHPLWALNSQILVPHKYFLSFLPISQGASVHWCCSICEWNELKAD